MNESDDESDEDVYDSEDDSSESDDVAVNAFNTQNPYGATFE